jgi:hypothetical protein
VDNLRNRHAVSIAKAKKKVNLFNPDFSTPMSVVLIFFINANCW